MLTSNCFIDLIVTLIMVLGNKQNVEILNIDRRLTVYKTKTSINQTLNKLDTITENL